MEQTDKKISQMPPLQTVSGDEIVPVVKSGGNYSALVGQIVALARQTMVEAQAGKGLSANDFTDALKAKLEGLSNYDDTEVRALITAINGRLDTILGDGASTAIDTFNEIEAFLAGITDTQTLTGLLQQQKQTITTETDDKLAGKVDKVSGKGLSSNDYTTDDKEKLTALPTAAELTDVLAKKLDKEKWDAEHEQFNARGYYSSVGGLTVTTNERHRNSGIMPLNTQSPIIVKNVVVADFYSVVAFFDVNKKFISGVIGDANAKDYTVNSADFPVGAVFFAVSTYKEPGLPQPSYTNGPTQESREGAMAEALAALGDDKLEKSVWDNRNRQFGYTGHYGMDGKFYTAPNYANSGLIPVNRNFDIEFAANVGGSVASVVFYTADRRFIKAVQIPQTLAQQVLPAADIPEDATFFIISTASPAQSYYRNGSTIEARENAMSEALASLGSDLGELPSSDLFIIKGYFLGKRGNVNVASSDTGITPLIPLSKTYPIVLKNVRAYNNAVAVCFYDAVGNFISYPEGIENLNGDFTVTVDKYPAGACYFRACSEKAGSTYTNGPSIESREGAVSEAIQSAKLALFIYEFNAAAGANGKYDPVNAPDPQHPFYLNKLWLTYEEAVVSMAHINEIYLRGGASMSDLNIRTNMLAAKPVPTGWGVGFVYLNGVCLNNGSIEVLNVGNNAVDSSDNLGIFVYNCPNLHTIIGQIDLIYVTNISINAFALSPKLQEVRLYRLKTSISFKDCPLLSLATLQYLVDNAANTAEITVTVHPTVYGKLTDEQADIIAMMPENLLTGEMNDLSGVTRIDNGVTVNAPKSYFRMVTAPRLVSEGNGKLTLSCDVEGLQAGESMSYHIGGRAYDRPQWIISANGRATFSFEAKNLVMTNVGSLLFYDADSTYTGQGLKLTNFKLSYGEHDALPYTPPLSTITDDATREKAEWLSLMQIAEAKNINFVTTE